MSGLRLRRRPKNPEGRMPVMDHLRELRRRVIVMLLIVAVGAVVGWILYPHILDFLKQPYCSVPAKYRFHAAGHRQVRADLSRRASTASPPG